MWLVAAVLDSEERTCPLLQNVLLGNAELEDVLNCGL